MNVCGYWGAIASRLLFEAFGLGAYYLLVSLAAFDAVLLMRHEVGQPWLRAGGWLLSLVGVTTLAALAVPGFSPGPVIGAGGYLGAIGRALLQTQFASVGAYILAREHDPRRPAALDRLCPGAAAGLDRAASRPAASAAACCTSARPTPRSSARAAPTSTTSTPTTATARLAVRMSGRPADR